MRRQDRLVAPPYLRAAMNHEQGLEASGYYQKRTKRSPYLFYAWLSIIIAAVLALAMTGHHHEEEMTNIVDKKEVVSRWDGAEDIGMAISRELWIMREARNSAELIDRMYANK